MVIFRQGKYDQFSKLFFWPTSLFTVRRFPLWVVLFHRSLLALHFILIAFWLHLEALFVSLFPHFLPTTFYQSRVVVRICCLLHHLSVGSIRNKAAHVAFSNNKSSVMAGFQALSPRSTRSCIHVSDLPLDIRNMSGSLEGRNWS